jgi:hypothetical protein
MEGLQELGLELNEEEADQLTTNAEEQGVKDVEFSTFLHLVMEKAQVIAGEEDDVDDLMFQEKRVAEKDAERSQSSPPQTGSAQSSQPTTQMPHIVQEDAESVWYVAANGATYQVVYTALEAHQVNTQTKSIREVVRSCPVVPPYVDPFAPGAVWKFEAGFHKGDSKPTSSVNWKNSRLVEYPPVVTQLIEARFQAALRLKVPESLPPKQAKGKALLLVINGVVFASDEEARREIESCS